jgi:hypothetical protein
MRSKDWMTTVKNGLRKDVEGSGHGMYEVQSRYVPGGFEENREEPKTSVMMTVSRPHLPNVTATPTCSAQRCRIRSYVKCYVLHICWKALDVGLQQTLLKHGINLTLHEYKHMSPHHKDQRVNVVFGDNRKWYSRTSL